MEYKWETKAQSQDLGNGEARGEVNRREGDKKKASDIERRFSRVILALSNKMTREYPPHRCPSQLPLTDSVSRAPIPSGGS
jgi:hypothetical protein